MNGKRRYKSPLREAQTEQTRGLILQSLAQLLVQTRSGDIAVREIAAHAGISERTVYRYFPDKESLLNGLDEWLTDRMGSRTLGEEIRSVEDVLRAIPIMYGKFDEVADLVRAAQLIEPDPAQLSDGHRARTTMLRRAVDESLPELSDRDKLRFVAVLRTLIGSLTWVRIESEFGIEGTESGPLLAWVGNLMLDDARRKGAIDMAEGAGRRAE